MQRIVRNVYKRTNVFHCAYTPHHRFEDDVSVYHVLKNRRCFPSGCVQFKWRCKQFDKGQPCPRGYKYVGRKCPGCKYYYEQKQGYNSELKIADYDKFTTDLEDWEEWLQGIEDCEVEFRGIIHTVKPHMKAFDNSSGGHRLRYVGWLLSFRSAIIGYDRFEDPVYIRISKSQMLRFGFAPGMEVDGLGIFSLDRGRPIIQKFHRVEVLDRPIEDASTPSESEAIVAAATGHTFSPPPEKCMLCERGILVDVEGEKRRAGNPNRCMLCLEGIVEPNQCLFHLKDALGGSRGPVTSS